MSCENQKFESDTGAFLDWFKSLPGASFHNDLKLTDLRERGAGRGIIATADIPAETDLFTITRKSIIQVQNSDLARKLPQIFTTIPREENLDNDDEDEDAKLPDPWLDLILVMIYEYLHKESPWVRYFDVLPKDFDTLMFWAPEELEQLQASAIREKVGKDEADEMFKTKILPVIKEHQDVFFEDKDSKLSDDAIIELAHRMGSIIMAYAFDLEKDEDDESDEEDGWVQDKEGMGAMGMVPMADMLNADAEFNAHLNHGEDSLTMTSLRTIKAGEEVLNYYGPLPNCDLLRRYGYTSTKHTRYDVVELPWDIVQSSIDTQFSHKSQGSVDDEDMEESFVLERESGEPEDTGLFGSTAQFTTFPEELEAQVVQVIAPALNIKLGKRGPEKSERRHLRAAFLEIMTSAISARLKQYGSTIAEDEALLKLSTTTGRLKMAIDVRVGEKRLLQEANAVATDLLEKCKEMEHKTEEPKSKRQKTSR